MSIGCVRVIDVIQAGSFVCQGRGIMPAEFLITQPFICLLYTSDAADYFSSAAFHEGLCYEKLGRHDAAALAY